MRIGGLYPIFRQNYFIPVPTFITDPLEAFIPSQAESLPRKLLACDLSAVKIFKYLMSLKPWLLLLECIS
jgi:hypothetical protein